MKPMRKRGIVCFVASLPIWAVAFWLHLRDEQATTIGSWTVWNEPSDLTEGARLAALIGSMVALGVLFVDFVAWLLQGRFNKSRPPSSLS